FQETQRNRIEELKAEIAELHTQVEQLTALKKQIATTYYHDDKVTPETATDDQIKQAIIQLITNGEEDTPKLNENYKETINNTLENVPIESLKQLIDELVRQHVLSKDQAAVFYDELTIVNKYATDFEKPVGTDVHFSYLDTKPTQPEIIQINSQMITLSLDTTKDNMVIVQGKDSSQGNVTFTLDDNKVQEIQTFLNNQLKPYDYQTSITSISAAGNSFTIAKPTKISDIESKNSNKKDQPAENNEMKIPATMSLSVNLPLNWYLTEEQQKTSYNTVDYTWSVNGNLQEDKFFACYVAMAQPLVNDIPEIMKQFQQLDTTAQQIVTLYGTPNQSLSIREYAAMLQVSENQTKTIEELAGKESIYWLYDNITDEEQQKMITERLLAEYKKTGNQLYRETDEQINQLKQLIGTETDQNTVGNPATLYGTLNLMTIPDKLLQEAEK
ncbi:putative ATP synthase F1, delta subunit, partial [Enterococcus faecalis RP2S-4]